MFLLSDYDFELPEHLIAHSPRPCRDESRLLRLDRWTGDLEHRVFSDVIDYFEQGDLLVMNNTRVVPARLFGVKQSGGKAEVLILDYPEGMARLAATGFFQCRCLVKSSKRPKVGTFIQFDQGFSAEVLGFSQGIYELKFHCAGDFETCLGEKGCMPLPPYIKRTADDPALVTDRETYQTVYASEKGAVAAPTAGLHFTESLLDRIRAKGVETATLTLHVGYGTFVPVRVSDIRDHAIHSERYHISETSAQAINRAMADKRRIIAVGTTTVRTLEYAYRKQQRIASGPDVCDIFIYPGYEFKVIKAMITNFHIPQSTLLMLVSAFAGLETIKKAYQCAIRENYRFYSYGDSMLIV